MASAQAWSIKKRWASKFEEFLRTSSTGHLAMDFIRRDCVHSGISEKIAVPPIQWNLASNDSSCLWKNLENMTLNDILWQWQAWTHLNSWN